MKVKIKLNNEDFILQIDEQLMYELDTLILNVKNDWDFVIIISGDRMVRVGKSVIAQIVAAYLAFRLQTPWGWNSENIHFDSQDMINFAQSAPRYSVIVYDEGREGLAASKSGTKLQQDLLDYFAECGQLNHIFIIVLPDYFELKETMAVGRSEYLINVYRKEEKQMRALYGEELLRSVKKFHRGQFEFFDRKKKRLLFDIAQSKHQKNYGLVRCNFLGTYTNTYTVDKDIYIAKKKESLRRFNEKKKEERLRPGKMDVFRNKEIMKLRATGLSFDNIAKKLEEDWEYKIGGNMVMKIYNRLIEEELKKADTDA